MSTYATNKERAKTRNTDPTLTDQSSAEHTHINVILRQFKTTGTVPGPATAGISGDFTELPQDLRGYIETARKLKGAKAKLPKELQNLTTEELLSLTPEQLTNTLTPPPTQPPAEKPAEPATKETK